MMTRLGQIHRRFAGSGPPGESDQEQMSPATVGLSFWSAGGHQSVRATAAGRPVLKTGSDPGDRVLGPVSQLREGSFRAERATMPHRVCHRGGPPAGRDAGR